MAATRACAASDPDAMRCSIVIAEHPVRPAARRQRRFVLRDRSAAIVARIPWRRMQLKIERQMHAAEIDAVVRHQPLDRQIDLADQHAIVDIGPRSRRMRAITSCTSGRSVLCSADSCFGTGSIARAPVGIGRVVAELLVLDQMPDHIDAKAVHAALQPEAQHVEHRLDALAGLRQFRSGCSLQKRMIVVLLRSPDRTPRRCRRKLTASCSAARRPAPGRARCTNRVSGYCAMSAIR